MFFVVSVGSFLVHVMLTRATENTQRETSALQAAKGSIRIGLDAYAGYFPLRSDRFRNRLLGKGYRLELADDEGDYAARVDALAEKELDMAVFTVDSYILTGALRDYPGSLVAVLSESIGSDGIVSANPALTSLDAIKQDPKVRIAYTPNSPSQHLLKTVAVDFDMGRFLKPDKSWSLPTTGSAQALKYLENDKADVAVLWEPELSTALQKNKFLPIIDTSSTRGLIVDVLVVNRAVLTERPELAESVLTAYFEVLRDFRKDRPAFIEELASDSQTDAATAQAIAAGIAWISYEENASVWLGIDPARDASKQFRLYDAIERTVQVLVDYGDFEKSPLPQGDPRSLIYDRVLKDITLSAQSASADLASGLHQDSLTFDFSPLPEASWQRLSKVGTLKLRPISFQSGTNALSDSGIGAIKKMIAAIAGSLGLAGLAWGINLFGRKNALSVRYLQELRKRLQREREERLKTIARELKELNCHNGSVQMDNLKAKYDSFVSVVEEKYNPAEITFGRYMGIAEQIYLAGIDNLQQVAVALKSTRSINRAYVEEQLKHLDENGVDNHDSDYQTLRDRLSLLESTARHVDQLLVQNEKAMTQLVQTGADLAKVRIDRSEATMEMDQAVMELSFLADSMEAHNRQKSRPRPINSSRP